MWYFKKETKLKQTFAFSKKYKYNKEKKTLDVLCILYSVKKCMVTFKFNVKNKKNKYSRKPSSIADFLNLQDK